MGCCREHIGLQSGALVREGTCAGLFAPPFRREGHGCACDSRLIVGSFTSQNVQTTPANWGGFVSWGNDTFGDNALAVFRSRLFEIGGVCYVDESCSAGEK